MPKMMHVLSQIPSKTGSGVFLANLIKALGALGVEQYALVGIPVDMTTEEVVAMTGLPAERLAFVRFGSTGDMEGNLPGMSDVMPYTSRKFSSFDAADGLKYQEAFSRVFKEAFERFRPDVLFCNHLWLATSTCVSAVEDLPDLIVAAVSHGTDIRQHKLSPHLVPFLKGFSRLDLIFALHTEQVSELIELYHLESERIHVIGNGFDDACFNQMGRTEIKAKTMIENKHSRQNETVRLVYAGKLSMAKGVGELLDALELLKTDRLELMIAGSGAGPEAEALLQRIEHTKARVSYVGMCTQMELGDLFKSADIFVLPSYYEGVPLVILEALACGLKVIANDLPGIAHLLEGPLKDSGRVTLLALPKMATVDCPDQSNVRDYVMRLAESIDAVCKSVVEDPCDVWDCCEALESRKWPNVAEKIMGSIETARKNMV